MILDFAGLTILLLFFIRGYMKGIIVAAFSVIAVVLGIVCALKLSGWLGAWLLSHGWVTSAWSQLISYALLFIGVLLLVRLLAKVIESVAQLTMLGWLNGLIGGALYVFLAAVAWSTVLWIANQMHLISPETIATSKTYGWLQPVAPWLFEHIGRHWSFVKDIFADLQHFFSNADQNLPQHVGTH